MAEEKTTSVFTPIDTEADPTEAGPKFHVQFSGRWRTDAYLDELPDLCGQNNVNWMREKLLPHRGHRVVCASYGDWDNPADVCIECEDCGCVLVSAGDFEPEG